MEPDGYRCKFYGDTNSNHHIFCHRYHGSRLHWYYNCDIDSESIAGSNSHSNSCSHLYWPEFNYCCQWCKFLHLESDGHRRQLCSQPDSYHNV